MSNTTNSISFHAVQSIKMNAKKTLKNSRNGKDFFVRDLVITDIYGNETTISMYADSEDSLNLFK